LLANIQYFEENIISYESSTNDGVSAICFKLHVTYLFTSIITTVFSISCVVVRNI